MGATAALLYAPERLFACTGVRARGSVWQQMTGFHPDQAALAAPRLVLAQVRVRVRVRMRARVRARALKALYILTCLLVIHFF